MGEFLFLASVFLLAAVIAVPIAARLGLGSVLGYLLAGVAIGPGLGLVADTTDLQHFAEFGVVMMLFLIGLELDPRALWDMRHRLIGLGGLQVIITMLAVMVGAIYLGFVWQTALAIGDDLCPVIHRDRLANPERKRTDADKRRALHLLGVADAGHRRYPDADHPAPACRADRSFPKP